MWGFLKCWYPTTMGFPTRNDHFGVFGGTGYHHLRKHPYIIYIYIYILYIYIYMCTRDVLVFNRESLNYQYPPPTTTNMSIKYEAKDVNSNPSGQKGDTVDASEIRLTTPVG